MSNKKTNETETIVELDPKDQEIADLKWEIEDLQKQNQLLIEQNLKAEEKYNKEHELRREVQSINEDLKSRIQYLLNRLEAAQGLRAVEQSKRHGSIPKFVIVAAIALVVLMVSFMLQKLSAIGPSVGYGIQCGMSMVISWCYAIIYDRSRKN